MATVIESKKACAVNPLKMSAPLGACYAFMGVDRCMPTMHGSQGCTSFGLVLLVRHFKEAIPLQTTAMNEVSTILGGFENIEQSVLNIKKRADPALVAIASTGLTETKGDDVDGFLRLIREKHAQTLGDTRIVYVSTPDYVGGFEEGWSRAVTQLVKDVAEPGEVVPGRLAVLAPSHFSPGDIEELRELVEAFGLDPVIVPDVSGSLDGHIPENFTPTTLGGVTLDAVRGLGRCAAAVAIGEHMRAPAQALHAACGVAFELFDSLTGLGAVDRFVAHLARLSGRPVPPRLRRQRGQLQDVMLDAHFHLGNKRIAIGAEPDLLHAMVGLVLDLGAEVVSAVAPTASAVLERTRCAQVCIGDLEDLERLAGAAGGVDLVLSHSHGRQSAERLGVPLYRIGLPLFDRIGASHRLSIGYRGTRALLIELANLFIEHAHSHGLADWPLPEASLAAARDSGAAPGSGCGCDTPSVACASSPPSVTAEELS